MYTLKELLEAIGNNLNTKNTAITANTKNISANATNISANTKNITTNANAIAALQKAMPHIAEGTVSGQYSINISFGGFKICAGRSVITPSAGNTLTGKTIPFSTTFNAVPYVICSLTGGPQVEVCRISAASVTKTNFIAYIFASNTTERSFDWLAAGWA